MSPRYFKVFENIQKILSLPFPTYRNRPVNNVGNMLRLDTFVEPIGINRQQNTRTKSTICCIVLFVFVLRLRGGFRKAIPIPIANCQIREIGE